MSKSKITPTLAKILAQRVVEQLKSGNDVKKRKLFVC